MKKCFSMWLLFSLLLIPFTNVLASPMKDNINIEDTVEEISEAIKAVEPYIVEVEYFDDEIILEEEPEDLFIDIAESLEIGNRWEEEQLYKNAAKERAILVSKTFVDNLQVIAIKTQKQQMIQTSQYKNTLFDKGSNVPNDEAGCKSKFKSWMRASSIKARKSGQWKILHSENCYEDPETKFMMYRCEDGEERICCAVGSYYTELIGTKLDVLFEDGHIIKCILADQKANEHTDRSNRYHLCDGSVLEFVVGPNFKGDNTYPDWVKGTIYRIEVLEAVNDGKGFEWD